MAQFLVRLSDAKPEVMTAALVKDHVAWLYERSNADELIFCGPCDDGSAIIVLQCKTREDAERIAESDPFAKFGAYGTRSIASFRLASPANNFLLT